MAQDRSVYVATESFVADMDGVPTVVHKGVTRVRAGHPLLKVHGAFFEPVDQTVAYEVDVEEATAEPGRKRGEQRSSG